MEHILVGIGLVLGGVIGIFCLVVLVIVVAAFVSWANNGSH